MKTIDERYGHKRKPGERKESHHQRMKTTNSRTRAHDDLPQDMVPKRERAHNRRSRMLQTGEKS